MMELAPIALWGKNDCLLEQPLIPVFAHVDSSGGYGTYSVQVIQELLARKYRIELRSPSWNEDGLPLPQTIKDCWVTKPIEQPWELVIYPCIIQPAPWKRGTHTLAYLTMWESTRIQSGKDLNLNLGLELMNRCAVIMVPNAWNASVFSSCGVDTPIRVVPLGTNMSSFPLVPNPSERDVIVFGTAARAAAGGIRKGMNLVVEAFLKAFPKEQNVRLRVKCFEKDPVENATHDRRIDFIRKFLTVRELATWYQSLNVFVSGSASEGWGRHQQEAMATGRPVIGVNFGGIMEFFNEDNGYACDWRLVPGEGVYQGMGHYAKPTVQGLADRMQEVFEDRATLKRKSELAAASARRFTIENSVSRILDVLREFKMIP